MVKRRPKTKKQRSNNVVFLWPNYSNVPTHSGTQGLCHHPDSLTLLEESFHEAGVSLKGYKVHHLVMVDEELETGRKPTKAMRAKYHASLVEELRELDPILIITFGGPAFEEAASRKGVTAYAGRDMRTSEEFCEVTWRMVPLFHPDSAVSYPRRKRDLFTQVKTLKNILKGGKQSTLRRRGWKHLTDLDEILAALNIDMVEGQCSVWDYETTGLSPWDEGARIRCVGVCHEPGKAFTFDFEEGTKKEIRDRKSALKEWLADPEIPKEAHNAKFELLWTRVHLGIWAQNVRNDTMLQHHLLHEEETHRLEVLAYQYTPLGGYDTQVVEWHNQGIGYDEMPIEGLSTYCAGDVDATRRLALKLEDELDSERYEEGLRWNFANVVMPSVTALAKVEHNGMYIDPDALDELEDTQREEVETYENKLQKYREVRQCLKQYNGDREMQGKKPVDVFNLKSPHHMRALIYGTLKAPIQYRSKGGAPSTKTEALEEIKHYHPMIERVIDIRSKKHDLSVIDQWRSALRPDGMLSTNYSQSSVVTNRLSSSDPPLQNIPVNGRIKQCVKSRWWEDGGLIMQADFSQLEVRLLGGLSKDPRYIQAFEDNLDSHSMVASYVYDIDIEEVSSEMRYRGKRTQFGVIYGIGPAKLAAETGNPGNAKAGAALIDRYMDQFPGVRKFMAKKHAEVDRYLAVQSVTGRVRRLPSAASRKRTEIWRAHRQAGNFAVQNPGSDITLMVICKVIEDLEEAGLKTLVIGQVHDSIILDVFPGEDEQVAEIVRYRMEDWTTEAFRWLAIPMRGDITAGPDWKNQDIEYE